MATGGAIYRVGLILLERDQPARVLRRADEWLLAPTAPYEQVGDAPNVAFPTGLLHDPQRDLSHLYYGAADTHIGLATASYSQVLTYALNCPEPPPRR